MNRTAFTQFFLRLFAMALLASSASAYGQNDGDAAIEGGAGLADEVAPLTAEQEATKAQEEAERAARVAELTRELKQRELAISDLQFEEGIYHPALIEAYSDVAQLQIELEDYDAATQYLTDALQIARINTGLYSEQQLPLIDQLITHTARMQEWEEVDNLVHLDHHISSRVYDTVDQEYLAAAEEYGNWKLRVLHENLLQLSSQGLLNTAEDLSDFYGALIVSVEFAEEVEARNLLRLLDGKSQADLSLARSIANTPYSYFQGTASRYITRTRCSNVRGPNGQMVRQCYNQQVENPRYRQSQRDAKRFMLNRYMREVNKNIERMVVIRESGDNLDANQRQQLDVQIARLQVESDALRRAGLRSTGF